MQTELLKNTIEKTWTLFRIWRLRSFAGELSLSVLRPSTADAAEADEAAQADADMTGAGVGPGAGADPDSA